MAFRVLESRGRVSHGDSHEGALWAQAWMLLALLSWLLPWWKCEKSLVSHQLERSFFLLRKGLMGVVILFIGFGPRGEAEPAGLPAVHVCTAMSACLCCSVCGSCANSIPLVAAQPRGLQFL